MNTPKKVYLAAATTAVAAFVFFVAPAAAANAEGDVLKRVTELKLPQLSAPITTYYSEGAKTRAAKLQADLRQMTAYFLTNLGIQEQVTLAVLNPPDWSAVYLSPYGSPGVEGKPAVIFMPAQPGGFTFRLMMARKEAIPTELLQNYLRSSQKSFEDVAEEFVDIIGFHEVGHVLSEAYGIDQSFRWLNEFAASYFAYTFVSERKPEAKRVFDLIGRPAKARPRNTTLDDFELLYTKVDDYGWYQGMFERRIQEVYPKMGVQFLSELKRQFPARARATDEAESQTLRKVMTTEELIQRLETVTPGFRAWVTGFSG